MSEIANKDLLIKKAVSAGLGDKKFLEKISEENLENMVRLIESKDGEIDNLKAEKSTTDKDEKVIRVKDLVLKKKIGVVEKVQKYWPKSEKAE